MQADGSAAIEEEAARALTNVSAFRGHPRVQRLLLEAPTGQLALKLAVRGAAAVDGAPAPHRLTRLDPQAVCAHVVAPAVGSSGSVSASLIPSHAGSHQVSLGLPALHFPEGLLLLKTQTRHAAAS